MNISRAMQRGIWSPPPRGRYKINTDGACRPSHGGRGGYGGILRNDNGEWIRGFHGFIGITDSLTAEFHGILKGLKLLAKFGLMKGSILETDCQAAFEWVSQPTRGPGKSQIIHGCWSIINECRLLSVRNNITFKKVDGHCGNRCADKLAAMGIEKGVKYVEIKDVPGEMKYLVDSEKNKRSKLSSNLSTPCVR